jgi:hypothetical protein
MQRASAVACVVVTVLLASGCDEKLTDLAGPTPGLTVTFASVERDIFNTTDSAGRAGCINCHTNVGRTPASNLNLVAGAAYAQIVNRSSVAKPGAVLVIPGDPDNSYLVQKLEGASGIVGQRMPRTGGPYLTQGQMMILRRWIQQGAQNN